MEVVKQWSSLLREVLDSLSLEAFKAPLENALSNLIQA